MESQAISLLKEAGEVGLLLSELAKQLEQPASTVLKIIESLARNGQVKQVEEQNNGNIEIRIILQPESEWDSMKGCPCFICSDIDQCGAGQPTSPWNCEKLNQWLKIQLKQT